MLLSQWTRRISKKAVTSQPVSHKSVYQLRLDGAVEDAFSFLKYRSSYDQLTKQACVMNMININWGGERLCISNIIPLTHTHYLPISSINQSINTSLVIKRSEEGEEVEVWWFECILGFSDSEVTEGSSLENKYVVIACVVVKWGTAIKGRGVVRQYSYIISYLHFFAKDVQVVAEREEGLINNLPNNTKYLVQVWICNQKRRVFQDLD